MEQSHGKTLLNSFDKPFANSQLCSLETKKSFSTVLVQLNKRKKLGFSKYPRTILINDVVVRLGRQKIIEQTRDHVLQVILNDKDKILK